MDYYLTTYKYYLSILYYKIKGEKVCLMVFIAIVVAVIVGFVMQSSCPNQFVVGAGSSSSTSDSEDEPAP